jgi:hypothetical protein
VNTSDVSGHRARAFSIFSSTLHCHNPSNALSKSTTVVTGIGAGESLWSKQQQEDRDHCVGGSPSLPMSPTSSGNHGR